MPDSEKDGKGSVPAQVLDIAAIALSVVFPGPGAVLSGVLVVDKLLDTKRNRIAAETFTRGIAESFSACHGRIDGLETKLRGLDAEEAWVKGARAALMTARLDKARRMGQVLGSTMAADSPDWQEAAEFIADIEEFGDSDIVALKILWVKQREAFRVIEEGDRKMSTDANDYTAKWNEVLEAAKKAGISREEWSSKCGRLSGFGLVLPVQPNLAHQGPGDACFRLTTRAVRLLNCIGYPALYGAYPRWLYRPGGVEKVVDDYDAHLAAGEGWFDTPQA